MSRLESGIWTKTCKSGSDYTIVCEDGCLCWRAVPCAGGNHRPYPCMLAYFCEMLDGRYACPRQRGKSPSSQADDQVLEQHLTASYSCPYMQTTRNTNIEIIICISKTKKSSKKLHWLKSVRAFCIVLAVSNAQCRWSSGKPPRRSSIAV